MPEHENKTFFKLAPYRLFGAITVLIIVIASINPYTYKTLINGTALINWLLIAIMFVVLIVMIIDNLRTEKSEKEDGKERLPK